MKHKNEVLEIAKRIFGRSPPQVLIEQAFGVIGAGRCYLHQQQHGSSCSGWMFFNLAFSYYLQTSVFQLGFGYGRTFFKSRNNAKPC